jgi:ABC-type Fe3+-hydroxamate transport system substrate-binding protein
MVLRSDSSELIDGGSATLPAVQQRRVYVIDANVYTSRSEPRLVHGLELFTSEGGSTLSISLG